MQRSITGKALSLLLTLLLAFGVFAGIELTIPKAYATGGDEVASMGVTIRNYSQEMDANNNIKLKYSLHVTGESMFTGEACNWPLTVEDVTLTKTDGSTIHPQGLELYSGQLIIYLTNTPTGEYTISFADKEGVNVVFDSDSRNVLDKVYVVPRSAKPVITLGAQDANGEVAVTVSAAETDSVKPYLNVRINGNDEEEFNAEDNNPFTFKISAASPDNYPVKYIEVWTNHDELYERNAVASHTFAPAADAFQVVVTPTTDYSTRITVEIDDYREIYCLIATLSSQNGSGDVTYEIDDNYSGDFIIEGNGVYRYWDWEGDEDYEDDGYYGPHTDGTIPRMRYDDDWFDGYIPYIIATDAEDNKAYCNTLIPDLYDDEEDEPEQPSRPSGSSGSGSGSSNSDRNTAPSTPTPAPVNQATAIQDVKNAVTAAKNSPNGATVTLKNISEVSLSTLKEMVKAAGGTALKVSADSYNAEGKVDVRITIDPSLATAALNLSASTTSSPAVVAQLKFQKHFDNTVSVVSLSQKGSFGMPVRVAAKVDTKLNLNTLVLYTYDSATNTYTKIENPQYKVDKNGYVHFTTSVGGEIIISDKPLTKK